MVGALFISAVTAVARTLGMPVNMELMLGSMLTDETGMGTWFLGLAMHVFAGALFGVLYAKIFLRSGRATVGRGAAIGFVHGVLSGLMLAVMPAIHPAIPELIPAPGILLSNLGTGGVLLFLAVHVLFGGIQASPFAGKRFVRADDIDGVERVVVRRRTTRRTVRR